MPDAKELTKWIVETSRRLRLAENENRRLSHEIDILKARTTLESNPPTAGPVSPGSPIVRTIDMGIFKITVVGLNSTYSATRQIATGFGTWTANTDDTFTYTLYSKSKLAVDDIVLARFDGLTSSNVPIYTVYAAGGMTSLYKITGGPTSISGTYLYTGYKQKYSSGLSNDGGLVYIYCPNNTGLLPSGSSNEYHTGIDLGWTITVSDVVYPVIISTDHLGQSDFVAAPA